MERLTEEVAAAIVNPDDAQSFISAIEDGVDSLMASGIIDAVPIARTFAAARHAVLTLHEKNLLKQTEHFFLGLDAGTLSEREIDAYRENLSRDAFMKEDLERVLVILDSNPDWERSFFLGQCYREYILEHISRARFAELREAAERMFLGDGNVLLSIYQAGDWAHVRDYEAYQVNRLIGMGLLEQEGNVWHDFDEVSDKGDVWCTPLGDEFARVANLPHPIRASMGI